MTHRLIYTAFLIATSSLIHSTYTDKHVDTIIYCYAEYHRFIHPYRDMIQTAAAHHHSIALPSEEINTVAHYLERCMPQLEQLCTTVQQHQKVLQKERALALEEYDSADNALEAHTIYLHYAALITSIERAHEACRIIVAEAQAHPDYKPISFYHKYRHYGLYGTLLTGIIGLGAYLVFNLYKTPTKPISSI